MRYVVLFGSLCRLRLRGMTCPSTWTGALSPWLQGALRARGKLKVQREILIMSGAQPRVSGPARVQAMDGGESADTSNKQKTINRE
jgi:hypothetical protein